MSHFNITLKVMTTLAVFWTTLLPPVAATSQQGTSAAPQPLTTMVDFVVVRSDWDYKTQPSVKQGRYLAQTVLKAFNGANPYIPLASVKFNRAELAVRTTVPEDDDNWYLKNPVPHKFFMTGAWPANATGMGRYNSGNNRDKLSEAFCGQLWDGYFGFPTICSITANKVRRVANSTAPTVAVKTTKAPKTKAPVTKAPKTKAPVTKAPKTNAPKTKVPVTKAPTKAHTPAPTVTVAKPSKMVDISVSCDGLDKGWGTWKDRQRAGYALSQAHSVVYFPFHLSTVVPGSGMTGARFNFRGTVAAGSTLGKNFPTAATKAQYPAFGAMFTTQLKNTKLAAYANVKNCRIESMSIAPSK